jgi:hypothetical protein
MHRGRYLRCRPQQTCVIDEHIDLTELACNLIACAVHARCIADIASYGDSIDASRAQCLRRIVAARFIAIE